MMLQLRDLRLKKCVKSMQLPDYWVQCPQTAITNAEQVQFDQLIANALAENGNTAIDYALESPKWQFLNYLVENYCLVVHGSGNPNIQVTDGRIRSGNANRHRLA